MSSNLEDAIKNVLGDYPSLQAAQSLDGSAIYIKEPSQGEEESLVGTYSHDGFNNGLISETEIREDCEAYYREAHLA